MNGLMYVMPVAAILMTATVSAAGALQLRLPPAGQIAPKAPLTLTVPDVKGCYTIPYIQSSPDLRVRVSFPEGAPDRARVVLLRGGKKIGERQATRELPDLTFLALAAGEYTLRLGGLDAAGNIISSATFDRLAIGTVIAAIGDSITEGYHGHGFWRDDLNLRADMFPPEAVSKDRRNFPQYSPTTAWHRPDINCFQSWMTDLNNLLTDRWRRPVFIANEGMGGFSTAAYLTLMRGDAGWQTRMKLLRPQVWLLHLGVNDERAKTPAAIVAANLDAIVAILMQDYGAAPDRIFIARPCYDYADGAAPILRGYIAEIDPLITRRGLRSGPDFFAAYATDKQKWYGDDPVHPNIAGMEYMARLWAEALAGAA